MDLPSLTQVMMNPATSIVFVILGIILVGVGVGWFVHPGLGFAATGACMAAFGILLGSD